MIGKTCMKMRQPLPEWKKKVDQALWAYSKAKRALSFQEVLISELEFSTFIPSVTQEDGNAERKWTEEEYRLFELEQARHRRDILRRRKENIEAILDWAFPENSEKRVFIEAYWLTHAGTEIQIRSAHVLEKLPFLAENSDRGILRGNRNFYYWRDDIYHDLAEVLGYLPEHNHHI